jgi:tRNA A-37 threonylcarbamoyl transferase component Bud32
VNIGGVAEVARLVGVSRQRLAKLRERGDFPDPLAELAQGPVWDLDAIFAWKNSGLRQPGPGRPTVAGAPVVLGDRFILEQPRIGRGGFADVYRAIDRKRPNQVASVVAVKVLRNVDEVDPEAIRRFRRELRILVELDHPNVIPVLAHGDADDGLWYAMPLATASLADRVARICGHPKLISDVVRQVSEGLGYLHSKKILHRDLKPGNVLLTATGAWAISDFGLALETERKSTVLTSTLRAGMGSHWYTAPEQWRDARNVDQRSDIYSFGKILQELVTGELPIDSHMPAGIFRSIFHKATGQRDRRYGSVYDFATAVDVAVSALDGSLETAEEFAERVFERVKVPRPALSDLRELWTWAQGLDEASAEEMNAFLQVFPVLSGYSIAHMWGLGQSQFIRLFDQYCTGLSEREFKFDLCDLHAEFCEGIYRQVQDARVLTLLAATLPDLAERHDRWHVRRILVELLQEVRDGESAIAALEGLREAPSRSIVWSFSDFSLRSLHPVLRDGIAEITKAMR